MFASTQSNAAPKAYETPYDNLGNAEVIYSTGLDSYKPILLKLKTAVAKGFYLLKAHAPQQLKLPPLLVIQDIAYRDYSLSYVADKTKNDGTGSILIYEGYMYDKHLEGVALHEAVHALLNANWGSLHGTTLVRMGIEELLADLYSQLILPEVPLLNKERASRKFDIEAGFSTASEFTKDIAASISEDYLTPLPTLKTRGDSGNDCHLVTGGVRRYLEMKKLEALSTEEKVKIFAQLMQFFKTEFIDQISTVKFATAYEFNLEIIRKLEQSNILSYKNSCNAALQ